MAAGADLDKVFRVDVTTYGGVDTSVSLPRDLLALEEAVLEVGAALILLDPLMSRLDTKLDSHKDAEVRTALEPLTALANRTSASVLGIIHVNKSTSADPLTLVMGSRAFSAVARAVLFVMLDPDDENTRLLGQPKNNLGRTDLPSLTFGIESAFVTDTDEGPIWTGRVNWTGERDQSIRDALEAAGETADARSATSEAADWLQDYLTSQGGSDDSATIKVAGSKAGHALTTLKRARQRIKATSHAEGFPRRTYWTLAGTAAQSDHARGGHEPTGPTGPTGETTEAELTTTSRSVRPVRPVRPVGPVGPVGPDPAREGPTECTTRDSPSLDLSAPGGAPNNPVISETECPDCGRPCVEPPGPSCAVPDEHEAA